MDRLIPRLRSATPHSARDDRVKESTASGSAWDDGGRHEATPRSARDDGDKGPATSQSETDYGNERTAPSEPPNEQRKTELDRIIFFSDAVFAIALTLLALGIKVPSIPSNQAASQLTHKLFGLLPQVLTFTLSFFVIANFWMTHHQRFRYIEDYDGNLMLLNLIHLFFIVLLPFPTEVVSQYGSTSQGVILYALAVGACSLTSSALWWYATEDRRLVIPSLGDAEIKRTRIQSLIPVLIFFGSIIIAVFNPTAALLSWISLWFAARLTSRRFHDWVPGRIRRKRAT